LLYFFCVGLWWYFKEGSTLWSSFKVYKIVVDCSTIILLPQGWTKDVKFCNDSFGLQLWTTKYWISVEWHNRTGPSCQTTLVSGAGIDHKAGEVWRRRCHFGIQWHYLAMLSSDALPANLQYLNLSSWAALVASLKMNS
jgi:hypothetical protein